MKKSNIKIQGVLFLATILCNTLLYAGDENGRFAVKGAGSISCESYIAIKEKRSRDYYVFVGWLEGYLTAANQHKKGTYDLSPWQSPELLMMAISKHCSKTPKKGFITAVNDMIKVLEQEKLEQASEIVAMTSEGKQTFVYKSILKKIQERLSTQGFFAGAIDGTFTPPLRDAIKAYQKKKNIVPSGLPDQITLFHLFRKNN